MQARTIDWEAIHRRLAAAEAAISEEFNHGPQEDILLEAEGLTVGRFREIIHATMQMGALA
jgi:hypothetical protein